MEEKRAVPPPPPPPPPPGGAHPRGGSQRPCGARAAPGGRGRGWACLQRTRVGVRRGRAQVELLVLVGAPEVEATGHLVLAAARDGLGGKTSMQWVTIITYCLEDEAASGKAEAAVANREPGSQRRRRRGALPNANATSATRRAASSSAAASASAAAASRARRSSASRAAAWGVKPACNGKRS